MTRTDVNAEQRFTEIFEASHRAVYAYLLGRVGDRELARDLVQETFLRVWRRLDEVAALPSARRQAWIFTVARNLATDAHRSRATREATARALDAAAQVRRGGEECMMTRRSDLDRLLDAWARQTRLTPIEVADIRQRILATPSPAVGGRTASAPSPSSDKTRARKLPTPLAPTWWQSFASQMATVIVSAAQPRPFASTSTALAATYR
jgi:RNA polymerase sigma factor (sigma-70 family)